MARQSQLGDSVGGDFQRSDHRLPHPAGAERRQIPRRSARQCCCNLLRRGNGIKLIDLYGLGRQHPMKTLLRPAVTLFILLSIIVPASSASSSSATASRSDRPKFHRPEPGRRRLSDGARCSGARTGARNRAKPGNPANRGAPVENFRRTARQRARTQSRPRPVTVRKTPMNAPNTRLTWWDRFRILFRIWRKPPQKGVLP
jgi:hypothetical protein